MKQILTILTLFILNSCIPEYNYYKSDPMPLRQLVKSDDTTVSGRAAFFLIAGNASYSEGVSSKIKMYVLVNSSYKYLEYDLEEVRIKIDNSITVPYLTIEYSSEKPKSNEYLTNMTLYGNDKVVLNTPEEYLPTQLLPIQIK